MMPENQVVRILKNIITTQNIRGTDLIAIRVRHTDREAAADIVQAVADIYKTGRESRVIVHERPVVSQSPVSPNLKLNLLLGALAGLLGSPLIALLLMLVLQQFSKRRAAHS